VLVSVAGRDRRLLHVIVAIIGDQNQHHSKQWILCPHYIGAPSLRSRLGLELGKRRTIYGKKSG
jgi:hypothetical protein